ncbi:Uncharacterised protein [uncultured archaeon]|nr:Uncharacterised protein [uncultured archaeon]
MQEKKGYPAVRDCPYIDTNRFRLGLEEARALCTEISARPLGAEGQAAWATTGGTAMLGWPTGIARIQVERGWPGAPSRVHVC